MKEKTFKPNLCPREAIDLDNVNYPIYASTKLDGIRCIIHPELGIITRSLKQVQNKQLQEKFKEILKFCEENNIILDGELYSPKLTFQEIDSGVMTQNFNDEKTIKKFKKKYGEDYQNYIDNLLDKIKFYIFDLMKENSKFYLRQECLQAIIESSKYLFNDKIAYVTQFYCKNKNDVKKCLNNLREEDEGLILKSPDGLYKFGRSTIREATSFKIKKIVEKSGIIKGFVQATIVNPDAEKTVNELGYSVTSKKKDDRIPVEKLAAFIIDYKGQDLKVVVAATDLEKEEMWEDREQYLGKELNYKSMEIGQKEGGLPRHPVMTRVWKEDE